MTRQSAGQAVRFVRGPRRWDRDRQPAYDDARRIEWCRALGCVCVSVEYRLAPEASYPTPLNDCEAELRFIVDHAHDCASTRGALDRRPQCRWGTGRGRGPRWRDDAKVQLAIPNWSIRCSMTAA